MSDEKAFRKTGVKATVKETKTDNSSATPFALLDPRDQLAQLLRASIDGKPFSELQDVLLQHQGSILAGHILLDTLEEQGYSVDDFDAVGALTAASIPLMNSLVHAAASRGEDLDGFIIDFVYPSIKGSSIKDKRVILLDSWLSEKSYVQTSSLVTLRNGNELGLDFGIVQQQGAQVLAIASLIGGVDMVSPEIEVVNPANQERTSLPFIQVYKEVELRNHA
ncbi:MAG: orotate phosphoribosyltransferase [Bifidobacteriaceae bacterium]|nr:orotate phosphoribosyltransferase [Bifidobacteriaceae bacterium]